MAPLREIITRPIAAAEDDVLDDDDCREYSAPVPDCVEDVYEGCVEVCCADDRDGNETRCKCADGSIPSAECEAAQRGDGAHIASEMMV